MDLEKWNVLRFLKFSGEDIPRFQFNKSTQCLKKKMITKLVIMYLN